MRSADHRLGRGGWAAAALTMAVAVSGALLGVAPGQAAPADRRPTDLSGRAPSAYAGQRTPYTLTLTTAGGAPVAKRRVLVQRFRDGGWRTVARGRTDADGAYTRPLRVAKWPSGNGVRGIFEGDGRYARSSTGAQRMTIKRRTTRLRVYGPPRVVDEQSVRLTFTRVTGTGEPVPGRAVVQTGVRGVWHDFRTVRLDAEGRARLTVRPREDSGWRLKGPALPWVQGGVSPGLAIDNVPQIVPVHLPSGAPRPRVSLPRQARAFGPAANVRVSGIPDAIWADMVGRTWHSGCPVGRSGLRLMRANYWGYDGYRYRGELIVNAGAVGQYRRALDGIYADRLRLRSMYRVDRFGWSSSLQGGDDHESMAAGNTSAFNCRSVVNNPGVLSPHSWGRAFDLDTWENPYHSKTGWTPNAWWPYRSHYLVAWRSGEHRMVRRMRAAGFAWTYGTEDSQHFDVPTASGRIVGPPECRRGVVCE